MAKSSMVSSGSAFLLLVLILVTTAAMAFASPADVNIWNDMQGEEMQVNCKKALHHYFGEKTLLYGEHFGWGFTPNIWGTTKYSCSFRWGARVQEFPLWLDSGIIGGPAKLRACTHCPWTVMREASLRNTREQKLLFIHGWQ